VGCERKETPVPRDSAGASVVAVDAAHPGDAGSGWSASDGPALLVQGNTRDEAIVLLPSAQDSVAERRLDSASVEGATAELFGRGGTRLTARLGHAPSESDSECRAWPLRELHGESSAWGIGFVGAHASPLPMDSVDVLSARDSMALAAEASRLASAVTAPTDDAFQGLRFTVHDVRRFDAAPGVQAVVAHLVRKVNQEANPQEEQTLLVAERDSGATAGPYHLVYAERTHGLEEEVATPEVIAGALLGSSQRATLVVARDSDEGVSYALIERSGPGKWRVRWTSGATRCGGE
jgi:hypothetical protein